MNVVANIVLYILELQNSDTSRTDHIKSSAYDLEFIPFWQIIYKEAYTR